MCDIKGEDREPILTLFFSDAPRRATGKMR
jgi:hypothetical protein